MHESQLGSSADLYFQCIFKLSGILLQIPLFQMGPTFKAWHRKYTPELHRKAPDKKSACSKGILRGF